jgi:hypothetical protein
MASRKWSASAPSEQLEQFESATASSEGDWQVMLDEWPVKAIMAVRSVRDRRSFLVRWQGYGALDNTWEPEEHMVNSKPLLDSFFKRCGGNSFANAQC